LDFSNTLLGAKAITTN